MANGKMYALFSTELIHSALKNKHLSIEPFNEEAAGKLCNLDAGSQDRILKPKGDKSVFQVLRTAQLTTMQGDGLNQLGSAILRELAEQVNGFDIGRGLIVPNLHLWIRSWMSPVHSRALYGKYDPYEGRPDLYDDFWYVKRLPLLTRTLVDYELVLTPWQGLRRCYRSTHRIAVSALHSVQSLAMP